LTENRVSVVRIRFSISRRFFQPRWCPFSLQFCNFYTNAMALPVFFTGHHRIHDALGELFGGPWRQDPKDLSVFGLTITRAKHSAGLLSLRIADKRR